MGSRNRNPADYLYSAARAMGEALDDAHRMAMESAQCSRCGGFCLGPCEREPLAIAKLRFALEQTKANGDTVAYRLIEQAIQLLGHEL